MYTQRMKQQGFVSIIVASLIMVILGLITIGFTRIMQREQRQVLDRQLSRQALYAAESGINDVYAAISDGRLGGVEITECDGTFSQVNKNLDAANGVEYTCILYDKTPTEVVAQISPDQSKFLELRNSSNFQTLTYAWGNEDGNNTMPTCASVGTTNPITKSNEVPYLQIDLTNTSSYTRSNLINNTRNIYLIPCTGAGGVTSINMNTGGRSGARYLVNCNGSGGTPCSVTLNGLNFPSASSRYLTRVLPIYDNATVRITGTGAGGAVAEFEGAQTSIDVTARAADVVRRLRVAIPVEGVVGPDSVVHAFSGICKLLSINRQAGTVQSDCDPYPPGGVAASGAGESVFTTSRCRINAAADGCDTGGSAIPSNTIYWGVNFYNNARNSDSIVDSCTWDFGNRTRSGAATDPANACLYGQRIYNDYGPPTSPIRCTPYEVTLTIRFNNGYATATYRQADRVMPSGPGSPCTND